MSKRKFPPTRRVSCQQLEEFLAVAGSLFDNLSNSDLMAITGLDYETITSARGNLWRLSHPEITYTRTTWRHV